MENITDLTKIIKKEHENKWVAVSKDYKKVLGFSEDLLDLRNRIDSIEAVYLKIPEFGRRYAF
jgi:hypothetical protein